MGTFGQIWINIAILDLFGYKNNSFFDYEKLKKIQGIFCEKLADIKLQMLKIFENLFIKIQ